MKQRECHNGCSCPTPVAKDILAASEIRVEGLDCPNEARPIRAALVALPGVKEVLFDLVAGQVTVTYDPAAIDEQVLLTTIRRTGFAARQAESPVSSEHPRRAQEAMIAGSAALLVFAMIWCGIAGGSIMAGLTCEASPTRNLPAFAAFLGAIVLSWWFVLPKAWRSARAFRPDLHLLMTIAVIGAMALGDWFEAATVAVLFGLAGLLESWSAQRVRKAVLGLVTQIPAQARLQTPAGEAMVPAEQVRPGQKVMVLPGEKLPIDGRVVAGRGHVDQSPITGEARLVEKDFGSEVFAGSFNQDAALEIEVTRPASQSVLAQVIRLVRQGQANKSRSEQLVNRFAHYYTPAVLAGAVLVAALPPILGLLPWSESIFRALVLLVISCPCALVISTPVAVVSAMTALARGGALVKAGRHLEILAGARIVAFDKTGTLTRGQPVIDAVTPVDGYTGDEVLRIAASVEIRSEHNLARAIVRAARQKNMNLQPCDAFGALPGMGAQGQLDGDTYLVGNPRLLRERGIALDSIEGYLAEHEDCHHTAMVVATQTRLIGVILAADEIREEARDTIRQLHADSIRTIMLTGDNPGTARAIAQQAGMDAVQAELLPAEKAEAISTLRDRHGPVVMIGDGINDAPALAAADVGIAMGTIGTDTAIQAADVALMSDDLSHVPWLIDHARRTRRTIITNIVAAVGLKAAFLALATLGLANLWMAILADMGASLAVTFNGMRLLSAPYASKPQTDGRPGDMSVHGPQVRCAPRTIKA